MFYHYVVLKANPDHEVASPIAFSGNIKGFRGFISREIARQNGVALLEEHQLLHNADYTITTQAALNRTPMDDTWGARHMSGNILMEGTWEFIDKWINKQPCPLEYRNEKMEGLLQ